MTVMTNDRLEHEEALDDPGVAVPSPLRDGVTVGLLTVIAGTFGVMAAMGEVFVDALVFVVAFAGLAFWAGRSGSTRLRWGIAALVALFVAVNLVYAIPDLSHPESMAPFVTSAVVVLAGVVTVVLSVLAARGRPAHGGLVWTGTFGVLVLAALGSILAAAAVEDDPVQPGDTILVASSFEYPEELVTDPASGAVVVRNEDRARHTFVVEGQVPAVEVPAGSQVRVDLDLAPGTYRYFCDIAGHEAMEGTLVVPAA